jgi:hypothetical protein
MTLTERLSEMIRACFTGLWVQSNEHEDALAEIGQLCRSENWHVAIWDVDQGLRLPGATVSTDGGTADPLAAIRSLSAMATSDGTSLLVLVNFHRFLQSAEIVQAIARQVILGKQNRTFLVVLSPVVQLPIELEKLFVTIEHDLPSRKQLQEIAKGIATESGELPAGSELDRVLDAASGLTRYEAEGAFSLSLVRHQKIQPESIWELKSQTLKKSGLLGLHRGAESFDQLGGLDNLKRFCLRLLRPQRSKQHYRPRGVLLLSPPGCGKSQFAKGLGNETGRPTLTLDVGTLLGSLVGQSEQNIRNALRIADAMAPCILFCDEIEKALSGVASSGQTDSGVSARLFGNLLTWLNDHISDVFFVGTCNAIGKLPPEFARAERFDAIFFIDLPSAKQREAIWTIYLGQFELPVDQSRPADDNWTGAEIKACCRLAALLDVPLVQAAQNIVPVALTARESIDQLRAWAGGRCLSADNPCIYRSSSAARPARRVSRDPSSN